MQAKPSASLAQATALVASQRWRTLTHPLEEKLALKLVTKLSLQRAAEPQRARLPTPSQQLTAC